jgi:hypothetical protein
MPAKSYPVNAVTFSNSGARAGLQVAVTILSSVVSHSAPVECSRFRLVYAPGTTEQVLTGLALEQE